MARQFFEANNQGTAINPGYPLPYPAEMARMSELAQRPDLKDAWAIEQQNRSFDGPSGQAAWASEFGSHLSSPGAGMQNMTAHPECVSSYSASKYATKYLL